MIALNGKRVALAQLSAELSAAGVTHNGLGTSGDGNDVVLFTFDANGVAADLPAGAVAVVAAHTAPMPPTPANYGNDAADIDRMAAQAATQLRAFIALAPPSNAEVIANAKLQNRVLLALMRKLGL